MAGLLDELAESVCRNSKWMFEGANLWYIVGALAILVILVVWNW